MLLKLAKERAVLFAQLHEQHDFLLKLCPFETARFKDSNRLLPCKVVIQRLKCWITVLIWPEKVQVMSMYFRC